MIEILIEEGANVTERVKQGWTLLHAAAVAKSPKVIQVLCDNGLDVNERDDYGATPLHVAALNDHLKGAEKLLELGADLDAILDDGVVTYQKSIITGQESHIRDMSGKSPLELARSKKMRTLLKKAESS